MTKEGAPGPQNNPQKITFEQIAWNPKVSERNKKIVKGLLAMGEVTSERKVASEIPVSDTKNTKVESPTTYDVKGVEVFFSPHCDFYLVHELHEPGEYADPVPFSKIKPENGSEVSSEAA